MSAGMQAADKLWQIDPVAAAQALGPVATDKLHSWQGLRGPFTPEAIAKNLNSVNDPALAKVREDNRKAAMTETDSLKPDDIAYKLGTSLGIPILSRVAGIFNDATPAIPYDANAAAVMVVDYRA